MNKKVLSIAASIALLLSLPACNPIEWFKEKFGARPVVKSTEQSNNTGNSSKQSFIVPDDGSKIIVSKDGKPVITEKTLDAELDELIESNPQLKQMVAFIDREELKRNYLDGRLKQIITSMYIQDKDIDNTPEYVEEVERIYRSLKEALNQKYFIQQFPVKVSESEIKEFYNKNKEVIPNLMLSHGGVKTIGIQFESEQAAKDFLQKAKDARDVQKAAKAENLEAKVKDFNLINEQSLGIDNELRDAVLKAKSFPAFDVTKTDDKSYWVWHASSKEMPKHRPYDQVKEELKQLLEREKMQENIEGRIKDLIKEYNIVISEDYLKPAEEQAKGQQLPEQKPVEKAAQTEPTQKPEAPQAPAAQQV